MKLRELYKSDIILPRASRNLSDISVVNIRELAAKVKQSKLVYTVFDGDNQQLSTLMRRVILSEGNVPINPPSVLGYRDAVVSHKSKAGVLLDDLSLLRHCDAIYFFADSRTNTVDYESIPEGALIELLYARTFLPNLKIYLLDIPSLLDGKVVKQEATHRIDDILNLSSHFLCELRQFVLENSDRIPKINYISLDPLDYKYSEWFRSTPLSLSQVLLVPFLAIEPNDIQNDLPFSDNLLICWLSLLKLANSVSQMPPLHEQCHHSCWQYIESQIARELGTPVIHDLSWEAMEVPKAILREAWPISSKEATDVRHASIISIPRAKVG